MIDSHCHLVRRLFPPAAFAGLLQEARDAGVTHICAVSEHAGDLEELVGEHNHARNLAVPLGPEVLVFGGLHPVQERRQADHDVFAAAAEAPNAKWPRVRSICMSDWHALEPRLSALAPRLSGIGEIGLDFSPFVTRQYVDDAGALGSAEAAVEAQKAVFAAQLAFAARHGLPVTVHSRSAGHHALAAVTAAARAHAAQDRPLRVSMHAFDGNAKHALAALRDSVGGGADSGSGTTPAASVPAAAPIRIWFSIPPSAAAAGSAFRRLAARLPLSALLLESDAPALAPVRGEINTPANVRIALDTIAEERGEPCDVIERAVARNAREWLYGGGGEGFTSAG